MLRRIVLTATILLSILTGLAIAAFDAYTPETIPDSVMQPRACGMREASFLCDPNSVLDKGNLTANHLRLENALIEVRELTKCTCSPMDSGACDDSPRGFTVSVAIVRKMVLSDEQRYPAIVRLAAETFADVLRKRQSRGQCDDDVLIFVSADDKAVSTSLGLVTKRYLSEDAVNAVTSRAGTVLIITECRCDSCCGSVTANQLISMKLDCEFPLFNSSSFKVDNMECQVGKHQHFKDLLLFALNRESHFKTGDYTGGIKYMIESYTTLLKGDPLDLNTGWKSAIPLWALIVICVVLLLILLVFVSFLIYRCVVCYKGDRRAQYTMGTRM